jgi:hypothetical protein
MNAPITRRALVAAALALTPLAAQARSPEIYTGILSSVGAGGYYPVAYWPKVLDK